MADMTREQAVEVLKAMRADSTRSAATAGEACQNVLSAAFTAEVHAIDLALTALRSGGGEGESSAEWKAGFAAGCDGVMSPAYGLATDLHELEERLRSLKPQQDVVGGPEQYGFTRGIEAARDEVRRTARTLPHPQPASDKRVARYTRPLYTTHVPCWALPAVESALSMLDLQGYWHSDLAAFRDWLKEKSA